MTVFFGEGSLQRFHAFLGSPKNVECLAVGGTRLYDIKAAVQQYEGSATVAVLMAGNNELLRLGLDENMRRFRRRMGQKLLHVVRLLQEKFKIAYVFTIPSIPRLEGNSTAAWVVGGMNAMLRNLSGPKVAVIDLDPVFKRGGIARREMFEETTGQGMKKKKDLIHLNRRGMRVLCHVSPFLTTACPPQSAPTSTPSRECRCVPS